MLVNIFRIVDFIVILLASLEKCVPLCSNPANSNDHCYVVSLHNRRHYITPFLINKRQSHFWIYIDFSSKIIK